MRKEFELWARQDKNNLATNIYPKHCEFAGEYVEIQSQKCWEAWQEGKKEQWNEIDYSKPETWPELKRPVIRAWANGCFGNSKPFTDHEIAFLDEDDGTVFWNIQISSEQSRRTQVVSVDGKAYPTGMLDHYTHWCYAPQFEGKQ